ncbi:MAG: TSUP family transporter [Eubacteriales bacterium]
MDFLFSMDLTWSMILITSVGVFLASFLDAIAGGGGIVSVPTYVLAGLPMHMALGTNKISASLGSLASTGRYIKNGYINWKLAIPSVAFALIGSAGGTSLQLMVPAIYLQYLLLVVLPVVAFVVLRQRSFPEETLAMDEKKRFAIVMVSSFVVGGYDGFYGPGTGTFLLLIFTGMAGMDIRTASGNVKVVNLSSGIGALITSALAGQVFWALGLIAAVASFAGHYVGAGLTIKNGSKIVRPVVVVALVLLAAKVLSELV